MPGWIWHQTFIGGSPIPLATGQAISWQGTGRGCVPHGGDRGMAPGVESPHSSPAPRHPNAGAWWEAAGSFREEQKGPADLSILLGWCLGHLEDDGNQPGLEWVGSHLLTRMCTGMGDGGGGWVLLALSRGILGSNHLPGQGHPTFAGIPGRGEEQDAPTWTPHAVVPICAMGSHPSVSGSSSQLEHQGPTTPLGA